jgi:hypothetical protein
MKQILFTISLLCSFLNYGIGQINFQGCPAEFGATTYVLVPIGTTNDGGTIRNTYDTSPIDGAQACNGLGFGFCEFRIIWDVANNQWLFQITDGASFFTIYTNTSPSAPNPPDLTLGTWVENGANTGGTCGGNLTTGNSTLSGDVQGTVGGGAPEINLTGNGNSIVDGDVTPSTTDDTNFGNVNLGSNDVHTFTIDNTAGTAALTVSSINISGANAADFVRGAFPGSIAEGATGTFTLTFTPSAVGVRNATVTINNNDANEAVYNYAVRGTGVGLPEINMVGNGNSIVDGDVTPSTTDDTDFGNVSLSGSDVHTFTIDNTAGTAALTVSSVNLSGANPTDFLIGAFPGSIAAGATGTFTVTFLPGATGVRNAIVTVNNNDANEGVYNYAIRGTGVGLPEINLLGLGNSIVDGDVTPSTTDDTDFGNVTLGANDVHTFTIDNTAGTAALTISSINISGANAADFVRSIFPSSIAGGTSGNFTVTFTPSAVGVRNATVTVNNDDANEAVYNYAIRGTGVGAPEIDLIGNGNSITDGDVTPSITDDTDFDNINLGANDVHTFTIDNTAGTAALTVSSVNITGAHAADFVVGAFPGSIAAGATGTFTLTFTPSVLGLRNATVTINNNDANEAVYNHAVQGTGIPPLPTIAITEWITNPSGNDATDEWLELHNFGATAVDIQNWEIEDEDVDDDVITTTSLIIPAGGYVIIAKNKAAFEAQWLNGCPSNKVINLPGLTLANGADEIIVKDASNAVVWSVAYRNDEAVGRAAQYTEAPNFTNRIWGSKASTGVDRSGNDPATGTLGYENNNVTADPNVMTSTTGDMGSPFDGTYIPPVKDIVRGDALSFDGANDNVSTGITSVATSFTAECWVSLATLNPSTPFPKVLGKWRSSNLNRDIVLDFGNSTNLFRALISNEATGTVTVVSSTTLPVVDEWYHLAMSYDGITLRLYVNGIEEASQAVANGIDITPSEFYIGSSQNNTNYWNGQIDEVRIWNAVRTANEIRENMHLTLKDCPTGLLAYYQMNDGTGSTTLTDHSGNGNNGTLTNMDPATDWVSSEVNVGNDAGNSSNSQTINTAAGISTQIFSAANATMRFFAHSGTEDITVTYQAFTPNGITGATGVNIIQNPMWTVNKSSGTETMVVDYTFMFAGGTFTSTDPSKYSLYHRAMNSEGTWTKISTASAVTASTATFGKISLTGQFMVVQDSENDISDVRGNMYDFDGVDDYAQLSGTFGNTAEMTIEAWYKLDASTGDFQAIVSSDAATFSHFQLNPSGAGSIIAAYTDVGAIGFPISLVPTTFGAWQHLAVSVQSGNTRLYVNGVQVGTTNTIAFTNILTSSNVSIGRGFGSGRYFDGAIDEVRIWNVARSQDELRENMHLTLKGNETGLVSYYQFNNDDPIATVGGVKDAVGGNDGTTQSMATTAYLASEVAVAGGTSDRITIGAGGVYTFPNTDVTIEFGATTPNGEIVVSRLETEEPHGWETIGGDVDNEYFVVNNYGTNASFAPLLDITFDRLSYVSPLDVGVAQAASPLQVYKRADNAFGATWGTSLGGADNATAGTNAMISFNTTNNINSFSQIVLANNANNSGLPVELMEFDAARLNADKVQLDWATASELNNEGFYVERMLETENEFKTVAYVEGQGNSTAIVNYQLLDENSYTSVSYYRLRQVDFDGTTAYSQIKAVEGRDNKLDYIDVSIYPNPVQNELKVRFNELPKEVKSAEVRVMSLDGKILFEFTAGIQSYQLLEVEDVDQLSAGLYFLSIKFDNEDRVVQKFIKE